MNKIKKFLIHILVLNGCTQGCSTLKQVSQVPPVLEIPSESPRLSPFPGGSDGLKLTCDQTCSTSQKASLPNIQTKLNDTVNGQCFSDYFTNPKTTLQNTNNLTREQIVSKLREPISLTVNYYYKKFTSAVGYEDAKDYNVIHVNGAKVGGWSDCDMASLAGHEMSHAKGFYHNGNSPGPNQYTIPYQVNHAFEQCCK